MCIKKTNKQNPALENLGLFLSWCSNSIFHTNTLTEWEPIKNCTGESWIHASELQGAARLLGPDFCSHTHSQSFLESSSRTRGRDQLVVGHAIFWSYFSWFSKISCRMARSTANKIMFYSCWGISLKRTKICLNERDWEKHCCLVLWMVLMAHSGRELSDPGPGPVFSIES